MKSRGFTKASDPDWSIMREIMEVKVPHAGSVENAEITEWLVAVGDTVEVDQPMAEISTDKVDTELSSPSAGRVAQLLVGEGDEVAVGTVIALLIDKQATDEETAAALEAHTITVPGH